VTGHLVDGSSVSEVAERIAALLADPGRAAALGQAGREGMLRDWQWDVLADRLRGLLVG
jgi:phosphatidylinositol alpha-1,6-mannosyltransferase